MGECLLAGPQHRASGEIALRITAGVRHDGDDETCEVIHRMLLDSTASMTPATAASESEAEPQSTAGH